MDVIYGDPITMEVRARNSNVMLGGPKNLGRRLGAAALFNFAPDLIQTKTAPVARNFTHHEIIASCSLSLVQEFGRDSISLCQGFFSLLFANQQLFDCRDNFGGGKMFHSFKTEVKDDIFIHNLAR